LAQPFAANITSGPILQCENLKDLVHDVHDIDVKQQWTTNRAPISGQFLSIYHFKRMITSDGETRFLLRSHYLKKLMKKTALRMLPQTANFSLENNGLNTCLIGIYRSKTANIKMLLLLTLYIDST
jgi:hypothetical protein